MQQAVGYRVQGLDETTGEWLTVIDGIWSRDNAIAAAREHSPQVYRVVSDHGAIVWQSDKDDE